MPGPILFGAATTARWPFLRARSLFLRLAVAEQTVLGNAARPRLFFLVRKREFSCAQLSGSFVRVRVFARFGEYHCMELARFSHDVKGWLDGSAANLGEVLTTTKIMLDLVLKRLGIGARLCKWFYFSEYVTMNWIRKLVSSRTNFDWQFYAAMVNWVSKDTNYNVKFTSISQFHYFIKHVYSNSLCMIFYFIINLQARSQDFGNGKDESRKS